MHESYLSRAVLLGQSWLRILSDFILWPGPSSVSTFGFLDRSGIPELIDCRPWLSIRVPSQLFSDFLRKLDA
jgi:hypothetical protein